MKDKLFIFIIIVLLALFAVSILENIPQGRGHLSVPYPERPEDKTLAILTTLEQAGLKPQEANYYQVMDE